MPNTRDRGAFEWRLHGAAPPSFLTERNQHEFGIVRPDPELDVSIAVVKQVSGKLSVLVNRVHAGRMFEVMPTEADVRECVVLRVEWDARDVRLLINGRPVAPFAGG